MSMSVNTLASLNAFFYLWTFFGKQNMWCGMLRTLF